MIKFDLKQFEGKFGLGFTMPLVHKINEIIDSISTPVETSSTELIRLGQMTVSHTNGVRTIKSGTCEHQGSAGDVYTPIKDMKIKKVVFITSLTSNELDNTNQGAVRLDTSSLDGIGGLIQESLVNQLELDNPNITYGMSDAEVILTKEASGTPTTLEALKSQYALQVDLYASIPTGTYVFEVYIEVEYLD